MPCGIKNIYGVYENGVLIAKGGSEYIAEKFGVSERGVPNYPRRNNKLLGIYEVKIIEKIRTKGKTPMKIDRMDYLYRHLAEYGNTVLNEEDDPFKYIPALEEKLGKRIWTRKIADKDDPWNYEPDMSKPGKFKRGVVKYYYVLETA